MGVNGCGTPPSGGRSGAKAGSSIDKLKYVFGFVLRAFVIIVSIPIGLFAVATGIDNLFDDKTVENQLMM